jgi:hypothetical protein
MNYIARELEYLMHLLPTPKKWQDFAENLTYTYLSTMF